jgi:uncharacterized RDD family membrane protein YckC
MAKSNNNYAGFWIRLLAYVIDVFIVNVIFAFLFVILILLMYVVTLFFSLTNETFATFVVMPILFLFIFATPWLYFALMESSPKQATLGKMAVGIKVTDMNGKRIGFGRATGRHFAKILSGIILGIGYLMIAFTEKKQGLHDIMSGCLVIKKR